MYYFFYLNSGHSNRRVIRIDRNVNQRPVIAVRAVVKVYCSISIEMHMSKQVLFFSILKMIREWNINVLMDF